VHTVTALRGTGNRSTTFQEKESWFSTKTTRTRDV
jgi:hypothetical protein